MSGRCGIPLSTLAKVEHDRLTLTYDKLLQVSQRLKIPVSELFAEPESDNEPAVTARRSIGRLSDAVRVKTRNYDYHYLCPELRRKRMIPVLARLRVKSLEEFGDLVRHSGEEYTYVLEGRVVLHTEFYDPLTLEVGESVYIDSNMTSSASTFSRRYFRRLVPGIGTIFSPRARTQASASCAGVQRFSRAISVT